MNVDRIKCGSEDGFPISGFVLDPSIRVLCAFVFVELFAFEEEEAVHSFVFLSRGDEAQ